ncbi:MAG: Methyl-accepting chemotaxis sensory transducer [Herbinix sp.]|jgi:methyl-accepting chemotaxis protein|nr:Methyl-accepting chemotaxis sensory transducer [Herbinix sp.]
MAFLRNRKVAFKLWLMVLPIIITVIYILIQFGYQMNKLNDETKKTYYDTLYTNSSLILNADRDFYQATMAERILILSGDSIEQSSKESLLKDYNENCALILECINSAIDNIQSNQELYSEFKHSKTQLTMSQIYNQFVEEFSEWQSAYDPNTGEGFIVAKNAMFDGIRNNIKMMTELLDEYSINARANMQDYITQMILKLIVLVAIAMIVMAILCTYIIRFIQVNIKKLTHNMNLLADNDLSFHPHSTNSRDELGTLAIAISTLIYSLRDIVTHLVKTSSRLSDASNSMRFNSDEVTSSMFEIAKTVGEIAEGASSQAEDAQQLVQEITNLGNAVYKSTESAKELNSASQKIMSASQEGLLSVNKLEDLTLKNQKAFQSIFNIIDTTSRSTGKIGEASAMISDIAKNTNLLALNASIEAARAGEAGKGFSVIAEEICKLSDQSKKSTMVIDEMLNELTNNIRTASIESKTVQDAVKLQANSVSDTKNKYLAIVSSLDNINKEIIALDGISQDMEQSRVVAADFGSSVSAISEEYAASTEETSATTEEVLAAMTNINQIGVEVDHLVLELKALIDKFKIAE